MPEKLSTKEGAGPDLSTQLEEEEKVQDSVDELYQQPEKEEQRARFVIDEIKLMREQRNRAYKWFGSGEDGNDLTLAEYIDASEKRVNGYNPRPAWKDEWQSNVFDPLTREKLVAMLSKLAAQRMKTEFLDPQGLSTDIAKVVTNLYDLASRGKNGMGKDVVFLFKSMFEAASKGTVIREETYRDGKRKMKVRDNYGRPIISGGKAKTMVTYEWEDVWSEVVPLEEFYPGDVTQTDLQLMGKCARVQYMTYETFRQFFNEYKKAKYVNPMDIQLTDEERIFFSVEDQVPEGMVQVIRYYNRITDAFDIVANNILLTELNNPLPFMHGQLPFTVGRFEMLSNRFFYGMSLPHKIASWQDITNSVWNLTLDQLMIALKTPIFNATGADIDTNWLYPGQTIDLPKHADRTKIWQQDMNIYTNMSLTALNTIKQRIDSSSGTGAEATGVAGAGRARTAEEVATAREAALQIAGLFLSFMEWAEEDRAEQRIQIMLEKYSLPLKQTGEFRTLVIDNVKLLNDRLGKMLVNITEQPRTKVNLNKANMKTEEVSQVIDVRPDAIRNFKHTIKIVPNSSVKDTEIRRLEKELQWYQIARPDPLFNPQEAAKDLAAAFGKDVNDVLAQTNQGQQAQAELMNQMGLGKKSPTPEMGGVDTMVKPK